MGSFWNELRITVRTLMKARGFTFAATLTLALGIGLAAAALAIVNAYLVRSLPYPAADRLYSVAYSRPGEAQPEGLEDLPWASVADVVEHPIAWDLDMFYLTGGEHTDAAPGAWVTPGFMQGLGIRVAHGRTFSDADFAAGAAQVALISDDLWRTRFGGDSAVLGRSMPAYVSDRPNDPETFSIVGILPPDFWHLNRYTQVLTPLRATTYPYFVRLRERVPVAAAERRIETLVRDSRAALPEGWRIALRPVQETYIANVRPMLLAVGTAVGLVVLLACANVALLVLLRGMRRRKEVALRLALGAGKPRVARMLLLETSVIAVTAAMIGTFAAWLTVRSLAPTIEQQLGTRIPGGASALSMDPRVLFAIVILVIVIAVLLSLAPIVATVRKPLFTTLRQTKAASSGGAGGRRTRYMLIGLEVAGSLALLVGSGLMVRTVVRMLDVNLGARYTGLTATSLAIREQTYPTVESRVAMYDRLLAALHSAPGASAVALSFPSPLLSYNPQPVRTDDDGGAARSVAVRSVTPGYFTTLAIPLTRGRDFADADRATAEKVVIVSEAAAERLWPGVNPVGRRIRLVEQRIRSSDTATVVRTVVGIARDVRQSPTDEDIADAYVPLAQAPGRFPTILRRATTPAEQSPDAIRGIMTTIDRDIAVNPPQLLDDLVERQLARPRFLAALFGAFGLFASMLGILGLYAVIAYAVKQREHEIAIRMAVGAGAEAIMRLFMREGVLLLLAGIVAGGFVAVALGRLLESQLFGVQAVDAATLITASVGLGLASLAAIWWPARRATRTDPIIALREE